MGSLVLVPVDFSPASLAAAREATRLAGSLSAELELVHVLAPAGDLDREKVWPPGAPGPASVGELLRAQAQQELGKLVQAASDAGIRARPRLLEGEPGEALLRLAGDERPQMIVVGSHGHGTLRRALLGSTSERLLRHAPCPVLVVRA